MPTQKTENNKGMISLVLAGLIFATYGVFTRLIDKEFAVAYQTWTRGGISLIILLLIGLLTHSFKSVARKDWKWFFAYACGGALVMVPFTLAVLNLPLGTTLFLFYSISTILSFIYGSIFFKEKLDITKVFSIVLALFGIALLYFGNISFVKPIYIFWTFLSAFFYSLYTTFNKKISQKYSVFQIALSCQLAVFLINLIISLSFQEKFNINFLSFTWLLNLIFTIFGTVTIILIIYGFKRVEVQKGSLLLLSELVFVLIFGFLFYQEVPNFYSVIGAVLITLALVIPNLKIKGNKQLS